MAKTAEITANSVAEWLAILAAENAKRRTNRRVIYGILIGVTGFLVTAWTFSWFARGTVPDFGSLAPMLVLIGSTAGFTAQHKVALNRMSEFATRESAGYLLEAYATSPEKDIKEVGLAALPLALSRVEASEDFDDYQRGLLYRQLNFQNPIPLVASVLECIGLIAGPEAIAGLERFHADALEKADPEWQRLGHRALQLLPDVRIRAARGIIEARVAESQGALEREQQRLKIRP